MYNQQKNNDAPKCKTIIDHVNSQRLLSSQKLEWNVRISLQKLSGMQSYFAQIFISPTVPIFKYIVLI